MPLISNFNLTFGRISRTKGCPTSFRLVALWAETVGKMRYIAYTGYRWFYLRDQLFRLSDHWKLLSLLFLPPWTALLLCPRARVRDSRKKILGYKPSLVWPGARPFSKYVFYRDHRLTIYPLSFTSTLLNCSPLDPLFNHIYVICFTLPTADLVENSHIIIFFYFRAR